MKKSLLYFALGAMCLFTGIEAKAQAISYVGPRLLITTQTPSAVEGTKNFTYTSDPGITGPWGAAVDQIWNQIPLVMIDATDTIGCSAHAAGSLAGKWALIWRKDCEFGAKALNAQNAGAVGVIIVNNVPGAGPINMGAGAVGNQDTIPIVMVSNADGNEIDAMVHSGNQVYVSLTPYGFNNTHDLCIPNSLFALAPGYALPASQLDAANGDPEAYKGFLSAWVANTGTSDETNVKLKLDVNWVPTVGSPASFFKDSITIPSLAALDSLDIVNSPNVAFDMHASGTGRFDFTYTASSANTDDLPIDNTQTFSMYATNGTFCNSKYNIIAGEPLVSSGLRVGGTNPPQVFTWGPLFYVAHATDVYNMQMALYADTSHHDLEFIQNTPGLFYTVLFKWVDANSNDVMEASEVTLAATGNHTFSNLDSQGHIFVAPFDNGTVHLDDNTYYWACAVMSNLDLYMGIDAGTNYFNRLYASDHLGTNPFKAFWAPLYSGGPDGNGNVADTISMLPFIINNAVEYMPTDSVPLSLGESNPAVALNTFFIPESVKSTAHAQPNKFTLYPNPASSYVNVKVDFQTPTNTSFDIMNAVGQVVYRVNKGKLKNDVVTLPTANLATGNYYIIIHANGRSDFKSFTVSGK